MVSTSSRTPFCSRSSRDPMPVCRKKSCSDMIPVSEPLLAGNELGYLRDCVATGWISSGGKYIERFEQDWAGYCGKRHGVAVANGTAALQIAIDALRLDPGDEIIMPSFTIISRTRAIMPVHIYGHPVDMDPLLDLAEKNGVAIVEDAAQAHGCEYLSCRDGRKIWRRCGGLGTVSAFSFYANKLVTTGE